MSSEPDNIEFFQNIEECCIGTLTEALDNEM